MAESIAGRHFGGQCPVLIGHVGHQSLVLELGEPQILRKAVVQLAREACPLLERGALRLGHPQPIERGIGAAQRAHVGARLGVDAQQQHHEESKAQRVGRRHEAARRRAG